MTEISLQEYCEQVEDMIDQGRYAQAVAHGKHILGTYPKYVTGYRLLGRAMLEARRDDDALDMFLRVLSADPEDMLSWVALSEIYDRRDELEASVWCLERAFELSVDNQLVGEELRQLYGRRDGAEPERVELTRGALARLYLKGDLLSRSVSEFRALLDEQPDRVDLEAAFAEALWRNEQRLEASEVCQRILDKLPYCLKANLLLGEIWVNSGREEGQTYLRRAEALDPQNAMAQALFGDASPLQAQDVRMTPLEYMPSVKEERPAWMVEVEAASVEGPPLTEGEAALVDIAAALEAQIEIPSWLEEIDVGEAAEAPQVPAFMASMEEPSEFEEPTFAPEEEAPEWLAGVGEDLEELVRAEDVEQEPSAKLVIEEEHMVSEQVPDWLAGLGAELTGEEEEAPGEGKVPDFLSEIGAGAFAEEVAPSAEEEVPDWLAGLREQAIEDVQEPLAMEPALAEIPDWMQELAPSVDRMSEVEGAFGWTAFGEPEVSAAEEPVLGAVEEPIPGLAEEPAHGVAEEAFGWTAFGEPEAGVAEEFVPGEVEEAAPVMEEAIPEVPPVPSVEEPVLGEVEEAFGWTAFGVPEVFAPSEVGEAAPEVEEAVPEVAPVLGEGPPPGVVEEVMAEAVAAPLVEELVPAEVEEVVAPSAEELEAPPVAEIPVEKAPAPAAPPPVAPKPEVRAAPPVIAAPPPKPRPRPPVVEPVDPFAVEKAYLKENPRDYDARLNLARALWQAGRRREALEAYSRLVRAGKVLDVVTAELEEYLEQWPDVSTQRVLGDAYMKSNQLEKALHLYRQALENL